jgi:hypothetical protein
MTGSLMDLDNARIGYDFIDVASEILAANLVEFVAESRRSGPLLRIAAWQHSVEPCSGAPSHK